MNNQDYSVAVVGLGAMGSAALYHLSKMGIRAVGFDQYSPPHNLGSTHGDTRITRLAIGEGSEYVPLVKRSHELWRSLEAETEEQLFVQCGGLVMASENNPFLKQTIQSAKEYQIDYQIMDAEEIQKDYPVFNVTPETVACLEPSAGYVFPEKVVAAHLTCAKTMGAEVLVNTKVDYIDLDAKTIQTENDIFFVDKIIVSAGAWTTALVPEMNHLLRVYRQVLYWFDTKENYKKFTDIPIFIWEFGKTPDDFIYGFPAIDGPGGGVKIATEEYEKEADLFVGQSPASSEEVDKMYKNYIAPNIPDLSQKTVKSASCLYTNTKDGRFLIDRIADDVWCISACSGHGFKHSAAIGEAVAEHAAKGNSSVSIDAFSFTK